MKTCSQVVGVAMYVRRSGAPRRIERLVCSQTALRAFGVRVPELSIYGNNVHTCKRTDYVSSK